MKTHATFTRSWRARANLRMAFTLIELLVVIAIIAIVVSLLLPTLSRAKAKGQSAGCQNNLKELVLGWLMYADDNEDRLAGSISVGLVNQPGSWVLGNTRKDQTASNIIAGVMFNYAPAVGLYHCPADKATVDGLQGLLRTRSYTLNAWMNSSQQSDRVSWSQSDFSVLPRKYSQIVNPPPTGTFVFIDEHEDSIDDGLWNTDPFGDLTWYNIPAVRHSQGAHIAYADGTVRPRKWLWPGRKWNRSNGSQGPANALDQQDLTWLMQLSPVQRP